MKPSKGGKKFNNTQQLKNYVNKRIYLNNQKAVEHIEEKINTTKKDSNDFVKGYLDNFKWMIGTIFGFYTFMLIASSFEINGEIKRIDEFKKETRKELLGETNKQAAISILDKDNKPLKNKIIEVNDIIKKTHDYNGKAFERTRYELTYTVTLKNTGEGIAKNPFWKIYYTESLAGNKTGTISYKYATDESQDEYQYESIEGLENSPLRYLSRNVSYSQPITVNNIDEPNPGIYPMKIKLFYDGKEKPTEVKFELKIPEGLKPRKIFKDQ